jgi:AcrR family transcriptional regulator
LNGRRERRKARTRTLLLEAALDLFSRRGIYDTRVEDITEAADLGKGAFYNYFESKEALIAEIMAEGVDLLDRRFLAAADGRGMRELVLALARQHVLFFREHPSYLLLFHQVRGLLQIEQRGRQRLASTLADYLRRLGNRLCPPGGPSWTDAQRLDRAAALAGAILGYASFCRAAGMDFRAETLDAFLAQGAADWACTPRQATPATGRPASRSRGAA